MIYDFGIDKTQIYSVISDNFWRYLVKALQPLSENEATAKNDDNEEELIEGIEM